jgi:hypothetical protein
MTRIVASVTAAAIRAVTFTTSPRASGQHADEAAGLLLPRAAERLDSPISPQRPRGGGPWPRGEVEVVRLEDLAGGSGG